MICLSNLRNQILIIIFTSLTLSGQIQLGGQLDLNLRNYSGDDRSNKTFKGYSNFDLLRFRIFVDAPISERSAILIQFLTDYGDITLYGAFLRINGSRNRDINLNIGMIPNTVGTYGPRSYSDKNPLVGTPLIYVYHSSLTSRYMSDSLPQFFDRRGTGYTDFGLPILYDACWNTGIEAFGSLGQFDWSVAALTGAVSRPRIAADDDQFQFTSRLSYFPLPELSLTLTGFKGIYYTTLDVSGSEQLLDNRGGGVSVSIQTAYLDVHSEAFTTLWETLNYGDLTSTGGYLEAGYSFSTRWFAAARIETMRFAKIDFEGDLGKQSWDFPLDRTEIGLGYHIDRTMLLKLVRQGVSSPETTILDDEIISLQLSTTF